MKLSMEVSLGPDHIVLDGNPAPPPQTGHGPEFSVHVCCGQTARWIKIPLGMEVELDPGNIVLDEDPAPPKKGARHPLQLWPMYCGQTAALTKMPLDMEVGLGPGHIVLDGNPPPTQAGHSPNFRPMSVVAKRVDGARCHLVRR